MAFLDKVTHFLKHEDDLAPPEPPEHEKRPQRDTASIDDDAREALSKTLEEAPAKPKKPDEQPIDAIRKVRSPDARDREDAQVTERAVKKLLSEPEDDDDLTLPSLDEQPAPEDPPTPEPDEQPVVGEDAQHTFHLSDGRTVDSLQELAAACKRMSPEVWDHHVTDDRNDFADWIKHNYSEELAYEATQADEPFELYSALSKHGAADQEPVLEDALSQLKRELAQVREDISKQLEQELSTVEQQEQRLAQLREDVKREQESFREQEQALKQEVERLQQEQAMFEETIRRVEQQNKQLFEEHEAAKQTHEEVARLRLQLHDEHEELKQAKRVVQKHLEQQDAQPQQADLLDMIEQVRSDIEAGRWEAARSGYRRVSKAFEQAELQDELRREVYNLIRGLYADIHLHAISE